MGGDQKGEKKKIEKVKELYDSLKEKYSLPEFQEINNEFELWEVSLNSPFFLREVRRKIIEKVDYALRLLERILYTPDADILSLYESSMFKKEELDEIFEIVKEIGKIVRSYDYLEIKPSSEEEDAEWIKNTYAKWKEIKVKILSILERKKEFWGKKIKYKSLKEYLG